jgi:hypothetical protein
MCPIFRSQYERSHHEGVKAQSILQGDSAQATIRKVPGDSKILASQITISHHIQSIYLSGVDEVSRAVLDFIQKLKKKEWYVCFYLY